MIDESQQIHTENSLGKTEIFYIRPKDGDWIMGKDWAIEVKCVLNLQCFI